MERRIRRAMIRVIGSFGVFVMSLLMMAFVCTWAWDASISGKLYYCTDAGSLDFWWVGDWVHHPDSVAHVVPRSMSEPDEIKAGWTITGLWCIWDGFVVFSLLVSAVFAWTLFVATKSVARGGERGPASHP